MEHPLRSYRSEKDLTLEAMAKLLGVSTATISRLETGKQAPTPEMAMQIEKVTGGAVARAELRGDLWGAPSEAAE